MSGRRVDYDRVAPAYDARYRREHWDGVERTLRDFARGGTRILEVGCGTGHWLTLLSDAGYDVAGLDASGGMLARARERTPSTELAHGRSDALPWPDASFDRVYAIHAFHHFDDKARSIAEMHRVLRSGGRAMILGLDPHTGLDRWWIYEAFDRALELDRGRYASSAQIEAAMRDHGFTDVRTIEAQHVPEAVPAREALARGDCAKHATSQLTILTDEEYAAGMARLHRWIEEAEARGEVFHLVGDLRVYATFGAR